MKIEVFEIASKEDKIYLELLEQYKINPELQGLLNKFIIPEELVLMGDFSLITMRPLRGNLPEKRAVGTGG